MLIISSSSLQLSTYIKLLNLIKTQDPQHQFVQNQVPCLNNDYCLTIQKIKEKKNWSDNKFQQLYLFTTIAPLLLD